MLTKYRSGDKSSDCNVGFFVRNDDEYDWLRSLLSVNKIKELLAQEYKGGKIDRFELPNLNAVHFLLRDHLDRGANSSSSYDILGKQGERPSSLKCFHTDVTQCASSYAVGGCRYLRSFWIAAEYDCKLTKCILRKIA